MRNLKLALRLLFKTSSVTVVAVLSLGLGKRTDEMAIRRAIGASRRNLVAQLLTESLILASLGGVAGLVIARWTSDAIAALLGIPFAFTLNPTVLLFAAVVTLSTGVVFGLYPALQGTRSAAASTPKGASGQVQGTRGAARYRWTLVTAQIAISTTLLISAGLFTKSMFKTTQVKLGFNPDNLVYFSLSPYLSGYTPTQSRALFQQLETDLAAQPGVTDVGAATNALLGGSTSGSEVTVQGYPSGPGVDSVSGYNLIGPGYFRAMGIPLLAGREFTESDAWGKFGSVVVNESFARKFKLGDNPAGKRMAWNAGQKDLNMEIVGLVRDTRHDSLQEAETPPMFYSPYRQNQGIGNLTFFVRAALPEEAPLAMIPRVVVKAAPNLPLDYATTMKQTVESQVGGSRIWVVLCGSFAALATLLAAIGLYGVMSYSVAQRTREFGIRMALGATRSRVRTMVLRQVGLMSLVGGVLGLGAGAGLARWGASMFFGIEGYEPLVMFSSTALLAIVVIVAGFLPAHRASNVEPMTALRYE